MFPSFIKSFLWGNDTTEECNPVSYEEHFIAKDDWVLISEEGNLEKACETQSECSENSQGWVVTPPSCGQGEGQARYSSLDDLLIEHPSMSVYVTSTVQHLAQPEEENRVALSPLPQEVEHVHPIVRNLVMNPRDYLRNTTNKIAKVTKKATKRHNQQKHNGGKQTKAIRKRQALRQGCFNAGRRHC